MFGQDLIPDMGPGWRSSFSNRCWTFTQDKGSSARQSGQSSSSRQSGQGSSTRKPGQSSPQYPKSHPLPGLWTIPSQSLLIPKGQFLFQNIFTFDTFFISDRAVNFSEDEAMEDMMDNFERDEEPL